METSNILRNENGDLCMRTYTPDWEALAKGFLELLDDKELNIMAYGMIPAPKFKYFAQKIFDRVTPQFTIKEIEKKLSRAIYANAKMVV